METLSDASRRGQKALVLSGGGILGAAYEIGALAALEEAFGPLPRQFDIFVGTSAGSFVAAVVSQGISATTLRVAVARSDSVFSLRPRDIYRLDARKLVRGCAGFCWTIAATIAQHLRARRAPPLLDLLQRAQSRLPVGFLQIDGLDAALCRIFAAHGLSNRFRDLKKRLLIPALDLDEGERVVFGEHPESDPTICEAVTASSAIPRLFGPVRIGDRFYIDGATGEAANLDVAIRHGATHVQVIDPIVATPFPRCDGDAAISHSRCIANAGLGIMLDQCDRIGHHLSFRCAFRWAEIAHPGVEFLLHQPDQRNMHVENSMAYGVHQRVLETGYRSMSADINARRDTYEAFFSAPLPDPNVAGERQC